MIYEIQHADGMVVEVDEETTDHNPDEWSDEFVEAVLESVAPYNLTVGQQVVIRRTQ